MMQIVNFDDPVKTNDSRQLGKKLHMRGIKLFNHFGIPEYLARIEKLQQRSR